MSSEQLLEKLQQGEVEEGDYNQKLASGKYVFEEFIYSSSDALQINVLKKIAEKVKAKRNIKLSLANKNFEGKSLFHLLITTKQLLYHISFIDVISNIFEIDNSQEDHIDWNEKSFFNQNNIAIECARLCKDGSVEKILGFRRDSLPVIDVNYKNSQNTGLIDVYAARIRHEGEGENQQQRNTELRPLYDNIDKLRDMGSTEPTEYPILPTGRSLDVVYVEAAINLELVRQIVAELKTKFEAQNHKVEDAIKDLQNFIKEEMVKSASDPNISEKIQKKAEAEFADSENIQKKAEAEFADFCQSALTQLNLLTSDVSNNPPGLRYAWSFKHVIAYIWVDAKTVKNEYGVVATLAKLIKCPWGKLVNLCHIAEKGVSDLQEYEYVINFKEIMDDPRKQEEVSNKVYDKLHALGFPQSREVAILHNWLKALEKDKSSPDRSLVDGLFNTVLKDMVTKHVEDERAKGNWDVQEKIYSPDYLTWHQVAEGIAAVAEFDGGSDNKLYELMNDLGETLNAVNSPKEDDFEISLKKYLTQNKGAFDLSGKNVFGNIYAAFLVERIQLTIPNFSKILDLLLNHNELIVFDWAKNINLLIKLITKFQSKIDQNSLDIVINFFSEPQIISEKIFEKKAANSPVMNAIKQLLICDGEASEFFVTSHMFKGLLSRKVTIYDFYEIPDDLIPFVTSEEVVKKYGMPLPQCFSSDSSILTPQSMANLPGEFRNLELFSDNAFAFYNFVALEDIKLFTALGPERINSILQCNWVGAAEGEGALINCEDLIKLSPDQILILLQNSKQTIAYLKKGVKLEDFAAFGLEQLPIVLTEVFQVAFRAGQNITEFAQRTPASLVQMSKISEFYPDCDLTIFNKFSDNALSHFTQKPFLELFAKKIVEPSEFLDIEDEMIAIGYDLIQAILQWNFANNSVFIRCKDLIKLSPDQILILFQNSKQAIAYLKKGVKLEDFAAFGLEQLPIVLTEVFQVAFRAGQNITEFAQRTSASLVQMSKISEFYPYCDLTIFNKFSDNGLEHFTQKPFLELFAKKILEPSEFLDIEDIIIAIGHERINVILQWNFSKDAVLVKCKDLIKLKPEQISVLLENSEQAIAYLKKGVKLEDFADFALEKLPIVLTEGFQVAFRAGQNITEFAHRTTASLVQMSKISELYPDCDLTIFNKFSDNGLEHFTQKPFLELFAKKIVEPSEFLDIEDIVIAIGHERINAILQWNFSKDAVLVKCKDLIKLKPEQISVLLENSEQAIAYLKKGVKLEDFADFALEKLPIVLTEGFQVAFRAGQNITEFAHRTTASLVQMSKISELYPDCDLTIFNKFSDNGLEHFTQKPFLELFAKKLIEPSEFLDIEEIIIAIGSHSINSILQITWSKVTGGKEAHISWPSIAKLSQAQIDLIANSDRTILYLNKGVKFPDFACFTIARLQIILLPAFEAAFKKGQKISEFEDRSLQTLCFMSSIKKYYPDCNLLSFNLFSDNALFHLTQIPVLQTFARGKLKLLDFLGMDDEAIKDLTSDKWLTRYGEEIPGCFRRLYDLGHQTQEEKEQKEAVQILRTAPNFENGIRFNEILIYSRDIKAILPELQKLSPKEKEMGMRFLKNWVDYISIILNESFFVYDINKAISELNAELNEAGYNGERFLYLARAVRSMAQNKPVEPYEWMASTLSNIIKSLLKVFTKSPTSKSISTTLKVEHLYPFSEEARSIIFSIKTYQFIEYTRLDNPEALDLLTEEQQEIVLSRKWNPINTRGYKHPSFEQLMQFFPGMLAVIADSYVSELGIPDFLDIKELHKLLPKYLALILSDPAILKRLPHDLDLEYFSHLRLNRVELICKIILDQHSTKDKIFDPRKYDQISDEKFEILLSQKMVAIYERTGFNISDLMGLEVEIIKLFVTPEILSYFKQRPYIKPADFSVCRPEIVEYMVRSTSLAGLFRSSHEKVKELESKAESLDKMAISEEDKHAKLKNTWSKHDADKARGEAEAAKEDVEKAKKNIIKPINFAFCDKVTIKLFGSSDMCKVYLAYDFKPSDFQGLECRNFNGTWRINHIDYFLTIMSFFKNTGLKPCEFKNFDFHIIRDVTNPELITYYKMGLLHPGDLEGFTNETILKLLCTLRTNPLQDRDSVLSLLNATKDDDGILSDSSPPDEKEDAPIGLGGVDYEDDF